jgi:dihydropteroate synthase
MGILNVTPDSFYDGGRFAYLDVAIEHARDMVAEGADIIDVGGESTRPGAAPVETEDELRRVIPVIEMLAGELSIPVSVDTAKPEVMREAVRAGASMINDVNALRAPEALAAAAATGAAVCLMHMAGEPRTMQVSPNYGDVIEEVRSFLLARVTAAVNAGIDADRLLLDPGFGFGKTLAHNLTLLAHLDRFAELGFPLLVGISRKSMIGTLLDGRPVEGRLFGGLSAAVIAVLAGARIIRTHDVAPTVDALKVAAAVIESGGKES